eukprot:snap_masked-scaffold_13-processed-gene-1.37-mRNA-1 protein AED:0.00 eAED:0.00 QI:25/0/0.5/1/0/0.5/2/57/354
MINRLLKTENTIHLFLQFIDELQGGHAQDQQHELSLNHNHDKVPEIQPLFNPFPLPLFVQLSLVMFLFNWVVRFLIVYPFAKFILNSVSSTPIPTDKITKFCQAAMEFIFYSTFALTGILLTKDIFWFREGFKSIDNSIYFWSEQPDNRILTPGLTFFYIAYCSRYFQGFVSVLLEAKRKDFWEMVVHHVVTCIVVSVSYMYGIVKIGLSIMIVMDLADPILQFGKLVLYVREAASNKTLSTFLNNFADFLFAIFVVVFTVTRIYLYPFLTWSYTPSLNTLFFGKEANLDIIKVISHTHNSLRVCMACLYILLVLQFIWFVMLVKVLYRKLIVGEDIEDTRSEPDTVDSAKKDA